MFVHSVYFWLNEDLSHEKVTDFEKGLRSLTDIRTVRHSHVGVPASTDRPVIDRSYSYALIVAFDDQEGHDLYQEDPIHDDFRTHFSSWWREVKIYDFVETPA